MKKITFHYFLVLSFFLLGTQLRAEGEIRAGNDENLYQYHLIENWETENVVLDEFAAFFHNPDFIFGSYDTSDSLKNLMAADCQEPTFEAYTNCDTDALTITVTVDVTDFGDASSVVVYDNVNSPVQELTSPGTVELGPYPYDNDIEIIVADADDEDCSASTTINSDACPPIPCQLADPFCSDEGLFFENSHENGTGETPDDMPNLDYGCLFTQPNPSWFFLRIDEPGDMTLHIIQNTEFDEDGNAIGDGIDVDFIAWGPFESMEEACNSLTEETQVENNYMGDGCSYSAAPEEDFGIVDAESGDIYVLLITNYYGTPGYIQVQQTDGDGSTDCSIVIENEILACYGDEVLLEAEEPGDDGANIWYKYDETTDEYELLEDVGYEGSITVTESGKYMVESFDDEGNIITEKFTVVISPEPELDNLVDSPVSMCGVDQVTLDGTVNNPDDFGGILYNWKDENGNVISTSPTLDVTDTGLYTLEITTVTINSAGDETEEECVTEIEIEVSGSDFEVDLGEDQILCGADSTELFAELDGIDADEAAFEWTNEDGDVVGDTQGIEVTESGTYTVVVDAGGCSGTDSVYVEVTDFEVGLEADNDLTTRIQYCEGEQDADTEYVIVFSAVLDGIDADDVEFTWYRNDEVISGADEATYTVVYDTEGDFNDEFRVEVVSGECSGMASLTTDVEYGPYKHLCKISEGISPGNNDGYNDNLDLTFLNDRSGIAKFTVYNRYGSKVFDQTDYTNEWHGQDNGGKELVSGTYYYVLEMKNEDPVFGKIKKGWIYVNQSIN